MITCSKEKELKELIEKKEKEIEMIEKKIEEVRKDLERIYELQRKATQCMKKNA